MLLFQIALFPGRLGPGNEAMLGMDQYTEPALYLTELQCFLMLPCPSLTPAMHEVACCRACCSSSR